MTKLQRLYDEQHQSPWLDNLTRGYLRDGTLARMVVDGIRGVTANPTIFAKAIEGSDAYDEQFAKLIAPGCSVTEAYWDMVVDDVTGALGVLRPTFDASEGTDGFVSIEVAPSWPATPTPRPVPPGTSTNVSLSPTCSSRFPPPPKAYPPSRR
jgi:transaldolase